MTAESKGHLEKARALLAEEPALAAAQFLSLAGRFRAQEVFFDCAERKMNWRFESVFVSDDFWDSQECLGWWWLLLPSEGQAWMAVAENGRIRVLSWDGRKVSRCEGPCSKDLVGVEFLATLPELGSPILSAMADKKLLDPIREGFIERARLCPIAIYFNSILWEWPLDIKLERICSFTSYDLLPSGSESIGFAVAHPWAHGCRYWLTNEGRILDLCSQGAAELQEASGNICHIPALEGKLQVQRRLNLLRKRSEACIELAPVRSFWKHSCYLMGHDQYLLPARTVAFGTMPRVTVQMRPLRAGRLFMQTDQHHEANVVVPIRHGVTMDPVYVTTKPGGMQCLVELPAEVAVTRQGRAIADQAWATQWARQQVQECQARQAPILE